MSEPNVTVLFRYRDLVAPTLDRHRAVIQQGRGATKYCWWGWWKRPSEDARTDIWEFLKKQIDKNGKETIGLFHSGNNEVHLAQVIDVIPPVDATASRPPALPTAELKFVPDYYRESVFSRAWLKLAKIENSPLGSSDFYNSYAYDTPPPLPKILPADLERLRDKRIIDGDELRAMDTTIWRIKKASAASGSAHFLVAQTRFVAPASRVTKAITPEPIGVQGTKILHLSDIHFDERKGTDSQHAWSRPGRKPMHEMIAKALSGIVSDIGILVISGDITFCASKDEYEQAHTGILALNGVLGLGPEHIVMCPGNHDILWTKRKRATYDPKKDIVPNVAPAEAKKQYANFYSKLLLHEPNDDLSMGRRFVLPHGLVFEACAVNSTSLAAGKKYLAGMGCVGPAAFETVRVGMGWQDKTATMALRTLVIHHHLVQTEDAEKPEEYYSGFGLAIDAQKTLREAARAGVSLAVHGHRHRPFYWRSSVYELPEYTQDDWKRGDVAIIGGGSAGSTDVADANFFNLIDVQAGHVRSVMYRSKDGAPFKPIKTWRATIVVSERGLALGPWAVEQGPTPAA